MDNSFVVQNESYDFILDTNNQIVEVEAGEIAVPLYHMQKYDLEIDDTILVKIDGYEKTFTISAFTRDSLMNPSITNAKRFVVNENDWEELNQNIGEIEYMITFQVYDTDQASELQSLYQEAGLPQKGSIMTYILVQLINAMSDGITAAVIILIAVLFIAISLLCLRFTLISTIEEDYREIGVMKALGISDKMIRTLYSTKYQLLAGAACVIGFIVSIFSKNLFLANITLYMGKAKTTIWSTLLPVAGVILIFLVITMFTRIILRKFKHISVIEAIQSTVSLKDSFGSKFLTLTKSFIPNINIFLGIKDVVGRIKVYALLCFVFMICTFIMIVPINLSNTLHSPSFVSYMGVGNCDLRIDLQYTNDIQTRYEEMNTYLSNDQDVETYTFLFTTNFKVLNNDGAYESMSIEIGDFSVFPITFSSGQAPVNEKEIALSVMNAEEINKKIGDTITIHNDEKEQVLTVCGIYQDVTKGGKTAKAVFDFNMSEVTWFTVNLNVKDGVDLDQKIDRYADTFDQAKITDIDEYVYQTLGNILDQLKIVEVAASILSIIIAILITVLFFKMLITKELQQIKIMYSLGFTSGHIKLQYITKAIIVLLIGIILGMLASHYLGGILAGLLVSGISNMKLISNPVISYLLCPLGLAAAVIVSILISSLTINKLGKLSTIAE